MRASMCVCKYLYKLSIANWVLYQFKEMAGCLSGTLAFYILFTPIAIVLRLIQTAAYNFFTFHNQWWSMGSRLQASNNFWMSILINFYYFFIFCFHSGLNPLLIKLTYLFSSFSIIILLSLCSGAQSWNIVMG